jgi:hypothetical protein
MRVDQIAEVLLEVVDGESIRTPIEVLSNPTQGAAVGIDCGFAFALSAQCVNMALVQ